jgi:hypothetical protein
MKILAIFVITLTSLSSCKFHCDGYPDSELKWIPYYLDDKLRYFNNSDTFELSVNDYFKTQPSTFHAVAMDMWCTYNGYYQTTTCEFGYFIKEEIKNMRRTDDGIYVNLTNNDAYYFDIWQMKSNSDAINLRYIADTVINQINYQEVFFASKDTLNGSPKIAWIILAKDKGVVEFYDFQSKRKWLLVNN